MRLRNANSILYTDIDGLRVDHVFNSDGRDDIQCARLTCMLVGQDLPGQYCFFGKVGQEWGKVDEAWGSNDPILPLVYV
jgi:hypothetical protein